MTLTLLLDLEDTLLGNAMDSFVPAYTQALTERYPFQVVPGYETFHFAKPDLAFYAEFLGQLGWPDEPIVMVGDDIEMDIQPARELGLAAYLVRQMRLASGRRLAVSTRRASWQT